MRKGDWMQTYTGKAFWPLDPRPEEIDILDIAHALSLTCRYGGHCKKFYSVAEHSLLVSQVCEHLYNDKQIILWGLLHDACEAYISDIPRPLKYQLAQYLKIEFLVDFAIMEKFGIDRDKVIRKVKFVDNSLLEFERKQLMSKPPMSWNINAFDIATELISINCYPPEEAEELFLKRFYELTK